MKKSNKNRADALGDRMKQYEAMTTKTTLCPNLPVYARIDGKAFHTLTRGLQKPFDPIFTTLMQATTHQLLDQTNAKLALVQSDEISLGWEDFTKAPFEGKLFKLESVLASMATALFYKGITIMSTYPYDTEEEDLKSLQLILNKAYNKPVCFDCRVFNLPSMEELANAFIWRENDAVRNSISSLAQANFSHKQLQGKSSNEMQSMLLLEKGINWNDLPDNLKRGTYFQKKLITKEVEDEIWNKIPVDKRPESREVIRSTVETMDFPIMKTVSNKVGTYFYGEEPIKIVK